MPITPYALNVKGMDFGQSVNMLNAVRQMQAANQQREMNALAMQKAQQDMRESEALRNALSTSDFRTPEGQAAIGKTGSKGISMLKDIAALQSSQTAQDLNKERLIKATDERYRREASTIKTPDDMRKHLTKMWNDPVFGGHLSGFSSLDEALADIPTDPAQFEKFKNYFVGGPQAVVQDMKAKASADAAKQSQTAEADRARLAAQLSFAQNVLKNSARYDEVAGAWIANPGFSQELVDQAQRIANQTIGGGQPMPPDLAAPISGTQPTVVPPPTPAEGIPGARTLEQRPTDQTVPTKIPTVSGQESTPTLLTSPADIQAARAAGKAKTRLEEKNVDLALEEPDVRSNILSNMSLANKTSDQITALLEDPALKNVTGNWAGSVPSLTTLMGQGNANANALIKALRSKAWLNSVRSFGKSSGLSPITDVEGAKLEAAYAVLDQTQGTPQFKKALEDFKAQLESSNRTIINGYNDKYGKLNIKGWQPMSLIGEFPDEAIQQLRANPTPKNIKFFNDHFGNDTAKYFLQGVK